MFIKEHKEELIKNDRFIFSNCSRKYKSICNWFDYRKHVLNKTIWIIYLPCPTFFVMEETFNTDKRGW